MTGPQQLVLATIAAELAAAKSELAFANEQLRIQRTGPEDVWFWQGDGTDDPGSLVCPVVMSAATLQALAKQAADATFYQRENARLRVDHESLVEANQELRDRVAALRAGTPEPPPETGSHVDDFIDNHRGDAYARFVLQYFRLPAHLKVAFWPFMERSRLFCSYAGKRWRVTGASRLGDVFLSDDPERTIGYEERVPVTECSEWAASVRAGDEL